MIEQDFLNFLTDDNQFLIIDGPAGTGKTTLISSLLLEANKLNLSSDAIAYTGKAASNLRIKCQGVGRTIHNFIYTFSPKLNDDEDKYVRSWEIDFDGIDILFVDECSMISSGVEGFSVNKEKTFLLPELLNAVKAKKIKKIMLVGDSYQLPPITKQKKGIEETLFPDSLNEYFLQKNYGLKGSKFSLRENKRYEQDLESYKLSLEIRDEIILEQSYKKSPKKWIKSKTSKDKFISSEKELVKWVIDQGASKNFSNIRILTFSNEKADYWNRNIRKALGKIDQGTGEVKNITLNEPMMNLFNKDYSKFYTGDSFIISEFIGDSIELDGDIDCTRHPSCEKKSNRPSQLKIRKVKITLFNENRHEDKIVQLVDRGVIANDDSTKEAYNHRLWCDFASRNDSLYKRHNKSIEDYDEWNDRRNKDENYGSGIACYAYASTVHKTQGDSFEYVVIDLEDQDDNLKWLYTALTRCTKDFKLYQKRKLSIFG